MSVLKGSRAGRARWLRIALLAGTFAAGCDYPFHPYRENTDGPFSMYGYLDLNADTQWIRVMPVRQDLLADPEPVDAVVTLEDLGSGRTVTLRDSLFRFKDAQLDTVGYVHNFYTLEPIEPGATYRVKAVRSDGATTTALVEVPSALTVSLRYPGGPPLLGGIDHLGMPLPLGHDVAEIGLRAKYVLYTDVIYTVKDIAHDRPGEPIAVRQRAGTSDGDMQFFRIAGSPLVRGGIEDVNRHEARVAVARSGWPYVPGLPAAKVAVPGTATSNVEHGFGFVGGLATETMPLPRCNAFERRPDGRAGCTLVLDPSSASVSGRVVKACGSPAQAGQVLLRERFAGGGNVILYWKTGWDGEYRFEGLEPGADLVLDLDSIAPSSPVHLPPLAPGEDHVVPDVSVPIDCGPGATSVSGAQALGPADPAPAPRASEPSRTR